MSFFQRQPPQLASSPFSSSIFGNISLLSQQQQEASRAFLGESKVMDSDMRLQSMDETLSDNEQDDSQSDKVRIQPIRIYDALWEYCSLVERPSEEELQYFAL